MIKLFELQRVILMSAFFSILSANSFASSTNIESKRLFTAPQKILFGSCMHQDKKMPIFDAINKEQSTDLFVFLGDNIYGDTEDMTVMANEYKKLSQHHGFQTLMANTPSIAIWDDHDFGINDGGAEYPQKEASRKLMLDFWHEPKNSARYSRKDGIYTAYMYGDKDHKVQVIMPDLRWNRQPISHVTKEQYQNDRKPKQMGPYSPDPSGQKSMLGDKQWQWLEKELQKPAKLKIIASSLQLLPDFTGWEGWANYPHDRERLFALIKKYKINGVVIISGDTHWGEVSALKEDQDYPLWEVTSSGLTQEWKYVSPNKNRVGNPINTVNYGEILIDWQLEDPTIQLSLKDKQGSVFTTQRVTLSSISPYNK